MSCPRCDHCINEAMEQIAEAIIEAMRAHKVKPTPMAVYMIATEMQRARKAGHSAGPDDCIVRLRSVLGAFARKKARRKK